MRAPNGFILIGSYEGDAQRLRKAMRDVFDCSFFLDEEDSSVYVRGRGVRASEVSAFLIGWKISEEIRRAS